MNYHLAKVLSRVLTLGGAGAVLMVTLGGCAAGDFGKYLAKQQAKLHPECTAPQAYIVGGDDFTCEDRAAIARVTPQVEAAPIGAQVRWFSGHFSGIITVTSDFLPSTEGAAVSCRDVVVTFPQPGEVVSRQSQFCVPVPILVTSEAEAYAQVQSRSW